MARSSRNGWRITYTAGHNDRQAPFSGDESDDADDAEDAEDAELALYTMPAFCQIDSLTIPLIDLFAPRDLYAKQPWVE